MKHLTGFDPLIKQIGQGQLSTRFRHVSIVGQSKCVPFDNSNFFVWLQGTIERYLPSGSLEALFPFPFPFPFPLPLPLASLMLQFEDITALLKVGEDIIRLFFAQAHTASHVSFHFESVTKHAIGSRTQQYPSPHLESHAVLTAYLNNDSRDESSDMFHQEFNISFVIYVPKLVGAVTQNTVQLSCSPCQLDYLVQWIPL